MALDLQPVPAQRVALVDSMGLITSPWFYFLKQQVVDLGLTALDQRVTPLETQMADAAVLLSFMRASR